MQLMTLAGLRRVVVTGGEPGIFSGIGGLLEELGAWGLSICLLTHGNWAQNLNRLPHVLLDSVCKVVMSFKAFDEPTARLVTGRYGVYRRQVQALQFADLVGRPRPARGARQPCHHATNVGRPGARYADRRF